MKDPGPMVGITTLIALLLLSLSAATWFVIDRGSQGRDISITVTGLQTPPAGSISTFLVKVFDPAGNAVPGARVSMSTISSDSGFFEKPRPVAEGITDGSGIVSLGFPLPEGSGAFDVITRCVSPSGSGICVHRLEPSRERSVAIDAFVADDDLGRPVLAIAGILTEGPSEKPIRGEEISVDLHALPGGVPLPAGAVSSTTSTGGFFSVKIPCGPRGTPHSMRIFGNGLDKRFDLVVPFGSRGLSVSASVISSSKPLGSRTERILSMKALLSSGGPASGVTFEISFPAGTLTVFAPNGEAEVPLDDLILPEGGSAAKASLLPQDSFTLPKNDDSPAQKVSEAPAGTVNITGADSFGNSGSLPVPLQIPSSAAEVILVPLGSTPAVGVEGTIGLIAPGKSVASIPGTPFLQIQPGVARFNLAPDGIIHPIKISLEDENGRNWTISKEIRASTLPLGMATSTGKFEFKAGERITVQLSGPAARKNSRLRIMIISGGQVFDSFVSSGDSFDIDTGALRISGPFIVSAFRPSASIDAPLKDAVHLPLFVAKRNLTVSHETPKSGIFEISTQGTGSQKIPISIFSALLPENREVYDHETLSSLDSMNSLMKDPGTGAVSIDGEAGRIERLHRWCSSTLREIDARRAPDPRGIVLKPENALKSRHTGNRYLSHILTFSIVMTVILGFCCLVATTAAAIHFLKEKKATLHEVASTSGQGSFAASVPGLSAIYAVLVAASLWLFGGGEQGSPGMPLVLALIYAYFCWKVTKAIRHPDPYQPIPAIYGYSALVILFLTPLTIFLSRVHGARIVIPGAGLLKFSAAATLAVFPMMLSVFSDAAQGGGPSSFRQVLSGLGACAVITAAMIFSPPFPPMDWVSGSEGTQRKIAPPAQSAWSDETERKSPDIVIAGEALGFPAAEIIDEGSFRLDLTESPPGNLFLLIAGPAGSLSSATLDSGRGRCSPPALSAPSLLSVGDSFEAFLTVANPGKSAMTLSSSIVTVPGQRFLPCRDSAPMEHDGRDQGFRLNVPPLGIETIPLKISPVAQGILPIRVALASQVRKWTLEAGICVRPTDGPTVWSGTIPLEPTADSPVSLRIPGHLRIDSCRLVAFRDLLDFAVGSQAAILAGENMGEAMEKASLCLVDDAQATALGIEGKASADGPSGGDFTGAFLDAASREWAYIFGTDNTRGLAFEPQAPTALGRPIVAAWLLSRTRSGGPLALLLVRRVSRRLPEVPPHETFIAQAETDYPNPEWILQAHLLMTSTRFLCGENPVSEAAALIGLVKAVSDSLRAPATMVAAIELETLAKLRAEGTVRALPAARRAGQGAAGSPGYRPVRPGRVASSLLKKLFPARKTQIERLPVRSQDWDIFHAASLDPDGLLGAATLLVLTMLEDLEWERGLLVNQLYSDLPRNWPWPSDPAMAVSVVALLPEILDARRRAPLEGRNIDKIPIVVGAGEFTLARFSSQRGNLWTGCGEIESDTPHRKVALPAGWPEPYRGCRPILYFEAMGPGPSPNSTLGLDATAMFDTPEAAIGDRVKITVKLRRSQHMSSIPQTLLLRLPESLAPLEESLNWRTDASSGGPAGLSPDAGRNRNSSKSNFRDEISRRPSGVGLPGKTVVMKIEAGVKSAAIDLVCRAASRCSLESAGSVMVLFPGGEAVQIDPGPLEIR